MQMLTLPPFQGYFSTRCVWKLFANHEALCKCENDCYFSFHTPQGLAAQAGDLGKREDGKQLKNFRGVKTDTGLLGPCWNVWF